MKLIYITVICIFLMGIDAYPQLSLDKYVSIADKKHFLDSCIAVTPEIKLPPSGDELYKKIDLIFSENLNALNTKERDSLVSLELSKYPYVPQEVIFQTNMSDISSSVPLNFMRAVGKIRVNDRVYLIGWTEVLYMCRMYLFDITDLRKLYPDYIVIHNTGVGEYISYSCVGNIINTFSTQNQDEKEVNKEKEYDLCNGFNSVSKMGLYDNATINDVVNKYDPFPEIPFSNPSNDDILYYPQLNFPISVRCLLKGRTYNLDSSDFQKIFLQNINFDSDYMQEGIKYNICGKYKIYDNIIYIVGLNKPNEYYMYLACCFNHEFYYPQIIKLYHEYIERIPEDRTDYYPSFMWTFNFDISSETFTILNRYNMEYPIYEFSTYKITPAGFEPKIQNQILPIKELYVSDKELDLKRYGYYIDEQDSVEVREVRTPWKKPELKIK